MKEYLLVPPEDIDALKEGYKVLLISGQFVHVLEPAKKLINTKYRQAIDLAEKDEKQ